MTALCKPLCSQSLSAALQTRLPVAARTAICLHVVVICGAPSIANPRPTTRVQILAIAATATAQVTIDPIQLFVHTGPHTGVGWACASIAPRRCPIDGPLATPVAHQRAATVTLASVDNGPIGVASLRTEHGRIDVTAGVPIILVASGVADGGHLTLLEDRGRAASRGEGPPACDPAARSCRHVRSWERYRAHATVQLH